MYPLKFNPILKSMIWGGDKLRRYKAISTDQKNIGESWELSGVPGNESVVSNGELAKDAIDYSVSEDYRTAYIATQNEETPLAECEYFKTHLLDLTEPMSVEVSSKDSFMIVICLEGNGELTNSEGNVVSLRQGETVLIPAFTDNVVFLPQNKMKLLLTHHYGKFFS